MRGKEKIEGGIENVKQIEKNNFPLNCLVNRDKN